MNVTTWAKVGPDNIVKNVELATADWVNTWQSENPGSEDKYILTEEGTIRQASVGWTYDPDNGNFYPPKPEGDDWVWSDEDWNWVRPVPPMPDGDDWVWDAESWSWMQDK